MAPLIGLDDVSFEYATVPGAGVRGIDLAVGASELVVLCGPSGSGKSTVTRLVNGLAPQLYPGPTSGRIEAAGVDVGRAGVARIAQVVGSVFQDPRTEFFTGDTISELAFGPENLAWAPARIGQRLDQVSHDFNLTGLLDRNILTLSGGEQQRLVCAVASMTDPAVMVLDEPSSALDAAATAGLAQAIATWKDQGKAVLVAEHRLDYLAGLADRFVYLEAGQVVHQWSRDQFMALGQDTWASLGLRSPLPRPSRPRPAVQPAAPGLSGLACRQVAIRRGRRAVLTIAQADLPLDQPLALIGANGSGKSTWARWLAGLGPSGRGTMALAGRPISFRQRLDSCYLVAQDTNNQLFADTVLGEVRLGRNGADSAWPAVWDETADQPAAAHRVLKALDLDHLADRHPRTLSGGERQRLVIAVALASGRQLVILDEPTSGLDAKHMRQVAAAIGQLHDAGAAVIVISHDTDLVDLTCGTAAVIDQGQLVESYRLDQARPDDRGYHAKRDFHHRDRQSAG